MQGGTTMAGGELGGKYYEGGESRLLAMVLRAKEASSQHRTPACVACETKNKEQRREGRRKKREESPDEEEVEIRDLVELMMYYSHETFDRDMVASAAEERRDEWFIILT